MLPVTNLGLEHFRTAAFHTALLHTVNVGHASVFHGRHLYLAGMADLSTTIAGDLPRWTEKYLFEPGKEVYSIPDWPERLNAAIDRAIAQDISLIAGTPHDLVQMIEAIIRKVSNEGRAIRNLCHIWPNLECVVFWERPVAPYVDDLKEGLGRRVAAQDGKSDGGLWVLDDTGVFFEFLPIHEKTNDQKQALPLLGVKAGKDYELVVTTPSGLCRYRTDEMVQFMSASPAQLVYRGRRSLALPVGESFISDHDLTDAMTKACRRHNWSLEGFHVSPFGKEKFGRHEWWLELKLPCKETPISELIEKELDGALRSSCKPYFDQRASGDQAPPLVRLITPGVFDLCRKEIGRDSSNHRYAVGRQLSTHPRQC
jgi:hypothetical protein